MSWRFQVHDFHISLVLIYSVYKAKACQQSLENSTTTTNHSHLQTPRGTEQRKTLVICLTVTRCCSTYMKKITKTY